jgi:uncharacterized membrane protein (DUF4010 family)
MLLSHALSDWFGDAGTLILSALSGITDVDAISLALARQSTQTLSLSTAALGIVIAASVNTLVKMGMVVVLGDKSLARRIAPAMLLSVLTGAAVFILMV